MPPLRIPPDRDLSIDFVRAVCLPIVVLLHAFQMGIAGDPLRAFNAMSGWQPLAWGTWVGMIMPLFFIAGGFAGITSWRRQRRRGETAGSYVRTRVLRLGVPVVLAMLAVLVTLGVMLLCGADPEFLRSFAFRLAEPLWFIAVYAMCTAFVPVMSRLHRTAPWATYFGLAGAAVVVDLGSRFVFEPLWGFSLLPLNWLFVWLFVQQLGFGVRDQWYARRPRWLLVLLTIAAYGLLIFGVSVIGYSHDMLDNLNPPTLMILVLALAQVYLFTLLQPSIRALMKRRTALVVVGVLGIYGMVIYLWHTVAMAVVVGAQLATGLPFPVPLSAAWWWTRIPWILSIAIVLLGLCFVVPKLEGLWPAQRARITPAWASIAATVLLMVGVGIVLVLGYLQPLTGIAIVIILIACVWMTIGGPGAAVRDDAEPRTSTQVRSA